MAIRNRNPRNFPINPIHTLLPNFERDFHKPFQPYNGYYNGGNINLREEFIHRQSFPIEHGHGHYDGYRNINQSIPTERTERFNPYTRPIDKQPIDKRPIDKRPIDNSQYLAGRIKVQEFICKINQTQIEWRANEQKKDVLANEISNINKEISKLIEEQAKLIGDQSALRDKNTILTVEIKELNAKLKFHKHQTSVSSIPPNSRGPISSRISRTNNKPVSVSVSNSKSVDTTHANEPVDYSKPNSGSFVLKLSNFCKESSSDEDVESNGDCENKFDFAD